MAKEVRGVGEEGRRWVQAPGSLHRRVGGDVLVLVPSPADDDGLTDEVVTLSGAAALLWLLLAEPAGRDELIADLAGALADGDLSGVAIEELGPAVDDALDALARAGATVTVEP